MIFEPNLTIIFIQSKLFRYAPEGMRDDIGANGGFLKLLYLTICLKSLNSKLF
jgi:hypothetical protein